MECSSTSYFNRKARCHRDRTFQEVPGKTSFRQEWPIRLCDYISCREGGKDGEDREQDPCDDFEVEDKVEEGPLDRFDQNIRDYMSMDIWSRDLGSPKHRDPAHPPILQRTTKSIIDEDKASEDDVSRSFAKKLTLIEKHFLFEQALMVAERAAEAAPPELVEEAALASARGYTMTLESERKPMPVDGGAIVEVISYLGITRPVPEYTPDCL